MQTTIGRGLKVTERERRLSPLIEPQRRDAIRCGRFHERLVDGHVPCTVAGRMKKTATDE